jgi:hypothetical protein
MVNYSPENFRVKELETTTCHASLAPMYGQKNADQQANNIAKSL